MYTFFERCQVPLDVFSLKKVKIVWDLENCRLPVNKGPGKLVTLSKIVHSIEEYLKDEAYESEWMAPAWVALRHANVHALLPEQNDDLLRSWETILPLYSDVDSQLEFKYRDADFRLKR